MHASGVVELGCLVKLHEVVIVRSNPLGRVDSAGDQVFEDLAAWQRNGRNAEFRHHGSAKARNTHFQAVQVIDRLDFFVEPAAHLCAGSTTRQSFKVKLTGNFVPQLLAALKLDPCVPLWRRHTKRYRREISECRVLPDPVVVRCDVSLRVTRSHVVKHVKRANALTGCEILCFDLSVGQFGDSSSKALCRNPKAGEIAWPCRNDV